MSSEGSGKKKLDAEGQNVTSAAPAATQAQGQAAAGVKNGVKIPLSQEHGSSSALQSVPTDSVTDPSTSSLASSRSSEKGLVTPVTSKTDTKSKDALSTEVLYTRKAQAQNENVIGQKPVNNHKEAKPKNPNEILQNVDTKEQNVEESAKKTKEEKVTFLPKEKNVTKLSEENLNENQNAGVHESDSGRPPISLSSLPRYNQDYTDEASMKHPDEAKLGENTLPAENEKHTAPERVLAQKPSKIPILHKTDSSKSLSPSQKGNKTSSRNGSAKYRPDSSKRSASPDPNSKRQESPSPNQSHNAQTLPIANTSKRPASPTPNSSTMSADTTLNSPTPKNKKTGNTPPTSRYPSPKIRINTKPELARVGKDDGKNDRSKTPNPSAALSTGSSGRSRATAKGKNKAPASSSSNSRRRKTIVADGIKLPGAFCRQRGQGHDYFHAGHDDCEVDNDVIDEEAVRDFLNSNPIFLNSFVEECVDRMSLLNWIHFKSPPKQKEKASAAEAFLDKTRKQSTPRRKTKTDEIAASAEETNEATTTATNDVAETVTGEDTEAETGATKDPENMNRRKVKGQPYRSACVANVSIPVYNLPGCCCGGPTVSTRETQPPEKLQRRVKTQHTEKTGKSKYGSTTRTSRTSADPTTDTVTSETTNADTTEATSSRTSRTRSKSKTKGNAPVTNVNVIKTSQPIMTEAEMDSFMDLYGIDLRQVRL